MRYFICASPLVKVYLPEWHKRLAINPDLAMDEETPFEFTVSSGTRGVRVAFNKPQQIVGVKDQVQAEALYQWLTGGPKGDECQETDQYGIVEFNPGLDMAQTFDDLERLELLIDDSKKGKAAAAERDKLRKEAQTKMRQARQAVIEASEARIKRAMRFNHNALVAQWNLNEEMKLGKHKPSKTEMFGMHILDGEIQAAVTREAALTKRVNQVMQNTAVV